MGAYVARLFIDEEAVPGIRLRVSGFGYHIQGYLADKKHPPPRTLQ